MKIKKILVSYNFILKDLYFSNKAVCFLSLISVIMLGLFPVLLPVLLEKIVSSFEEPSKTKIYLSLFLSLAAYIIVYFATDLLREVRRIFFRILGTYLTNSMHTKFIDKIKQIKYNLFYEPSFLNLCESAKRCCESEPMQIIFSMLSIISSSIQIFATILLLVKFDLYIFLILLLSLSPVIFTKIKLKNENIKIYKKQISLHRKINYYFNLFVNKESFKEIKIFGLNEFFKSKHTEYFKINLELINTFLKKELFLTFIANVLPKLGIFVSVFLVAKKVIDGESSVATFVCYTQIIILIQYNYSELIENLSQNYSSILLFDNYLEFLKFDGNYKYGNLVPQKLKTHTFEFKNVSFKYDKNKEFILKNINLVLKTGETICIIGKNGCGKTTLINLLLRLFIPSSGQILLDGIDIEKYEIDEYLKIISCISQDFFRYNMLIKEYIALSNVEDDKNDYKLEYATKKSNAFDFINKLPKTYNSDLTKQFNKDGIELSGGQWQKLALSRVFFSDAKILIFDEPTSSIDPVSEEKIYKEIEKHQSDKLKIFISHKLYVSKNANKVILMDNGEIIEVSTHGKLVQKNPDYRKMYNNLKEKYSV